MLVVHRAIKDHRDAHKKVTSICSSGSTIILETSKAIFSWFLGKDVRICSSIWIGAFVQQRFIILARCILCYILFSTISPVKTADNVMMSVSSWADPVVAAMDVRNNLPGAAIAMKYKDFALHFANSMYMIFTHIVAIYNAIIGGVSEQNVLSAVENVIMMPYSFAASYDTLSQLGIASVLGAGILWTITTLEYYSVGWLAKCLEYFWYGRREQSKREYRDIVETVLKKELTSGPASLFYTTPANILFERAVEMHGSTEYIVSLLKNSPLKSKCRGKWKNGKSCTHPAKYGHYCGHHHKTL
jgi:hypothetical protein